MAICRDRAICLTFNALLIHSSFGYKLFFSLCVVHFTFFVFSLFRENYLPPLDHIYGNVNQRLYLPLAKLEETHMFSQNVNHEQCDANTENSLRKLIWELSLDKNRDMSAPSAIWSAWGLSALSLVIQSSLQSQVFTATFQETPFYSKWVEVASVAYNWRIWTDTRRKHRREEKQILC